MLQPAGVYQQRLNYSGFLIYPQSTSSLTPAPSPPNVIVSGPLAQVLYGPRAILAQGIVKYFDLKSIYYSCSLDTELTSAVPNGCTIQFNGVKAATGITVTQELVYPQPIPPASFE